jgi:hypothetical protein
MTQNDLLQAAIQLDMPELKDFVAQITAVYQTRQAVPGLDKAKLLSVVHRKLPSQTQQRWDELLEKRDDATLTTSEYEELLQLTEVVEDLNLQRMTALSQLAQERGVDLRTMMRQLNLPEGGQWWNGRGAIVNTAAAPIVFHPSRFRSITLSQKAVVAALNSRIWL